jgi:hypothetical protein
VPAFERGVDPNPNANIANAITKHFFPIIEEFLLLSWAIEPGDQREVAEESDPIFLPWMNTDFWSGCRST